MTEKITCGTHGRQDSTFVCVHIIETLKDGEPRGFWWSNHEGTFEAVCSACNDLSEEEFFAQGPEVIEPLCFGCFKDAAAINGFDID